MKRIITLAVSALLALTVFTGCEFKTEDKNSDAEGAKNATVTFVKDDIKNGGYGDVKLTDDGEVYMKAEGNYANLVIDLKNAPINLKNSTVAIKLRATENFFNSKEFGGDDYSGAKFAFYTNDGLASEYPVPQTTVTKGTDGDAITLSVPVSDDLTAVWTSDNSIAKAYLPYITTIKLNIQKSKGEIYIQSISVKNAE